MSSAQLSDVAWDLIEHGRLTLTIAELNAVFVRLRVGDHREAIDIVLKSVYRAAGPRLPAPLLDQPTQLGQVGYLDEHALNVVAMVSRVGSHSSPSAPTFR